MVGDNFDWSGLEPQQPPATSISDATPEVRNEDEDPYRGGQDPQQVRGALTAASMATTEQEPAGTKRHSFIWPGETESSLEPINELSLLLYTTLEIFEDSPDNLSGPQWGGLYLLRQAKVVCHEIEKAEILSRRSVASAARHCVDHSETALEIARRFMPDDADRQHDLHTAILQAILAQEPADPDGANGANSIGGQS